MIMIEHRRIAFGDTPNTIDTPDPDWAGTHTPWVIPVAPAKPDLAAGEIVELSPRHSVLSVFVEVFDGTGDLAVPVAPGGVTVDVQPITRHRLRGSDVFEVGAVTATLAVQRRGTEVQVPVQGQTVFRVISAANLPAAGALVICAHEDMTS